MGLGRGPPRLSRPLRARSAALAGAQRRRARAATCTARQVHGAPRRPPALRPSRGRRGARGAREGPGPGRCERAGPRRRRDAAGTLLRPLPGSHSSPWAGRQAWCQEPGLPTPPPPTPAGALGRGGRGLASQPGAPRLSRSREEGCRRLPPSRAPSLPSRARRRRCSGRPSGHTEGCPQPPAAGSCPRASGAPGRSGPKRSPRPPSRPAPPRSRAPAPRAEPTPPAQNPRPATDS